MANTPAAPAKKDAPSLTLSKPGEAAPAPTTTAAPKPGAPVGFSGRLTRFDS